METLRYDDWNDTALTLHLVTQMLGKVKLERMTPQPEWNHTVLEITPDGFSTGLIPNGDRSFSISILVREGKVLARGVDGTSSGFTFRDGASVSEYYAEFNRMLEDVENRTKIYTTPVEMNTTTPFEQESRKRNYNHEHALLFFNMCVFARNALLEFAAPFRGKKILPSFFWGTFDVSTVLFSGKPAPFPGNGVIERVAFDEQMIEFGFWPGDEKAADPSFFVLPYPFLSTDLSGAGFKPSKAVYSKEKAEFFLALRDVLASSDPRGMLREFFRSTYELVTRTEKWQNLDWLNQPLLIKKGAYV